jgi:hypothetical protein
VPDDLLNRIRSELEQRLEETRAARDEHARLERAVAALEAAEGAGSEPPRTPRPRRPRGAKNAQRRSRAPRGENRERVLAAVRERAGASPAEIARASGVKGAVLYNLLIRLVASGGSRKSKYRAAARATPWRARTDRPVVGGST